MQRPESKPIGTIVVDVYEGCVTHSTFKGEVPALALQGIKVTLPRDYHEYMAEMGRANNEAVAEAVRIRKAKEAEDERKGLAVKQEQEAAELKKRQDIEKAEAELKKVKATVLTEMTQVEKRRVDRQLEEAEKKLADLQKVEEVVEEDKD